MNSEDSDKKKNVETEQASSQGVSDFFEAIPRPTLGGVKSKISSSLPKRFQSPIASRAAALLLLVLLIGFGAGWLGASVHNDSLDGVGSTSTAKEIVSTQSSLISAIAKDVEPSVVSVDVMSTTQTQDIFGFSTPSQEESEGTGIIISSNGYVLTNRHVVPQGATSVSVVLADGTTVNNVQVVGETAQTDSLDIAILKINNPPEALQPALLGDSSKVQVGDSVVAIGNALGQFQNTVTSGIISGRGRAIQAGDSTGTESEDLQDLIQTDAPINEGNSGGPLVNVNGEVIAINTAVASGTAQNIGFAIPINDALGIVKGILTTGKFERPYLGVYYVSLNPSVTKQYNLSTTSGAYIPSDNNGQPSIISGSPAEQAGLRAGDIITAVNGTKIDTNNSLSSLIDQNPVGKQINLTVTRGSSQLQLNATIAADPNS